MANTKKLCPFKKEIKRTAGRTERGVPTMTLTERLCYCAGDRCMAYRGGRCLRVEKEVRT